MLSPQKQCLIETLLPHGDSGRTSRQLMVEVGTNNPSDICKNLRVDNNLTIKCKLIPIKNRYGKKVYIGLYSIPDNERIKAIKLLASAGTPASDKLNSLSKHANSGSIVAQPKSIGSGS